MNRSPLLGGIASSLVFAALAAPVVAAPVIVPNFSFESLTLTSGQTSFGNTPNFTFTGVSPTVARGDTIRPTTALVGQNGNNVGSIRLDNNDNNATTPNNATGQLTSDSLGVFAANTVYTLTVALAGESGGGANAINYGFGFVADGALTATTLRAASTLSSTAFIDLSSTINTVTSPGLVGQNLRVALLANSTFDFGRNGFYDNIRLDASPAVVVPEPATFGFLALGLLSVVVARRRK